MYYYFIFLFMYAQIIGILRYYDCIYGNLLSFFYTHTHKYKTIQLPVHKLCLNLATDDKYL